MRSYVKIRPVMVVKVCVRVCVCGCNIFCVHLSAASWPLLMFNACPPSAGRHQRCQGSVPLAGRTSSHQTRGRRVETTSAPLTTDDGWRFHEQKGRNTESLHHRDVSQTEAKNRPLTGGMRIQRAAALAIFIYRLFLKLLRVSPATGEI